jgi:hypothetical protein
MPFPTCPCPSCGLGPAGAAFQPRPTVFLRWPWRIDVSGMAWQDGWLEAGAGAGPGLELAALANFSRVRRQSELPFPPTPSD